PETGNPVVVTYFESLAHGLRGPQLAHLFLDSHTEAHAVLGADNILRERFSTQTNTIRITLDTPFMGKTNFLTVTYTDLLAGAAGGFSATMTASDASIPPDTVNYTSDFFNFSGSDQHSFALSFSSIQSQGGGGLRLADDGNFLQSFTASGTGTFDTNFPTGEIHGAKFNDLNGDGIRQAGEPGILGWTIFLDEV